jgi:hypothetical protein
MGEPPHGLSLERLNNDRGYSPENCVWATPLTQSRNRRHVRRITICGKEMTVIEACAEYGIDNKLLVNRTLRHKRTHVEAFFDMLGAAVDPQYRLRKGRLTRYVAGPRI